MIDIMNIKNLDNETNELRDNIEQLKLESNQDNEINGLKDNIEQLKLESNQDNEINGLKDNIEQLKLESNQKTKKLNSINLEKQNYKQYVKPVDEEYKKEITVEDFNREITTNYLPNNSFKESANIILDTDICEPTSKLTDKQIKNYYRKNHIRSKKDQDIPGFLGKLPNKGARISALKEKVPNINNIIKNTYNFTDEDLQCRDTLIRFNPINSNEQWNTALNYIYLIAMRNPHEKEKWRIVKIGGTRKSMKDRTGSYLCGHHIKGRDKSGKASETNKYLYNSLYHYLRVGYEFKIFLCELPIIPLLLPWGKNEKDEIKYTEYVSQYYHMYESKIIEVYKKMNNDNSPFFCNNSDPNERDD